MKCNVGKLDRIARVVLGVTLMAFAFFANQPIAYVGIILVVTGFISFCPLYRIFNLSTACDKDSGCCAKK